MWFLEEVVLRVARLSFHLLMDSWSHLGGDMFKRGRLDSVYGWEESRLAIVICPYLEISISHMILFMFEHIIKMIMCKYG